MEQFANQAVRGQMKVLLIQVVLIMHSVGWWLTITVFPRCGLRGDYFPNLDGETNASYTLVGGSAEAAVTRGAQGLTMSCTGRHDEAMIGHSSAKRRGGGGGRGEREREKKKPSFGASAAN